MEPAAGAVVEDLPERLAGDEPEHDRGFGGEPAVRVGHGPQPGGHAAAGEPVVPGGAEAASSTAPSKNSVTSRYSRSGVSSTIP